MTEDALPYGITPDASPTSFDAQYKRVFAAAACRTQTELAELLEIRQSSISDAKSRKSIPSDWLVKLFEKKRVNPEWIRHGTGPMRLDCPQTKEPSKELLPHVVKVSEVRPPAECSSQELFAELVRRALTPMDLDTIQKEVADTWLPIKKTDGDL